MTNPLRARAEHAAKYNAHLVVPASDLLQLLNDHDHAKTRLDAVQDALNEWELVKHTQRMHHDIKNAVDGTP